MDDLTVRWSVDDPDHFVENIAPVAPRVLVSAKALEFSSHVRMSALPDTGMFTVEMNNAVVRAPPLSYVSLTLPLAGSFKGAVSGRLIDVEPGTAHVANHDNDFHIETGPDTGPLFVVNVSEGALMTVARALYGLDSAPSLAEAVVDLCSPAGSTFYDAAIDAWRIASSRSEPGPARVEAELQLGEALLSLIISETKGHADDWVDWSAAAQVETYIRDNLLKPMGLTILAEVGGVRSRSLCRAFKKRFGMGPMHYVRHLRLQAAHRALLGADRDIDSVTQVALHYGFTHLSRFAQHYREAFGELPSATLKQ